MTPQPTPWAKAGLPGRPTTEEGKATIDIAPGRIIRNRAGKVLFFNDSLDAKHVADMASGFLGRDIRRVFFLRKNGDRQQQFALAMAAGNPLTKAETLAVEAFVWLRAREAGKTKKKRVRLRFDSSPTRGKGGPQSARRAILPDASPGLFVCRKPSTGRAGYVAGKYACFIG